MPRETVSEPSTDRGFGTTPCSLASVLHRLQAMTTTEPDRQNQPDVTVGSVLADRYRLDEQVGSGGMSAVYRATDESLGRTVAIKLFRHDVADAADVRRQDAEMRLVASLSHPGVVTLFDAVADDNDRAFLVLQYVDGPDLRTRLAEGPLGRETTEAIAIDLADALAYVHDFGVIHRDLKPANILLHTGTARTHAMLTDFGIAHLVDGSRLTATGSIMGTAAFLSPEQALGKPLTPASDIYSLGLVLIECLTGKRVFPGSGLETAAARLSTDPRVPDDLSEAWQSLLREMTAREPEDRPTAAEVAARARALPEAEALEPTRRLTPIEALETEPMEQSQVDDATEPFAAAARSAARPAPPRSPLRAAPADGSLHRRALIGLAVALGAATAIGLVWWGITSQTPTVPTTSVTYPAVDGDLGVSLQQLQGSVEP
jgi:serine/threonine protein kinase